MEKEPGVVSMSTLGNNGRFGNQVFQYAFLRTYARRHGLRWETSPWIGQKLFGHRDQPISTAHRPTFVDQCGNARLLDKFAAPVVNVDLWGYFQYHTSWFGDTRREFVDLFRPVERFAAPAREAAAMLRRRGRTVVALHLRRGDFSPQRDFIAPAHCYVRWLEDNWDAWEEPVLYIASDDITAVISSFERFAPVTWEDLDVGIPEVPDYGDFFILTQADALAISNSSFSFAASLLNERARTFVRPLPSDTVLSTFDPWNDWPVMSRDDRFQRDTLQSVAGAVAGWRKGDPGAAGDIRVLRRLIADTWLGTGDHALAILYSSEFGRAHRLLACVEMRAIAPEREDEAFIMGLKANLTAGFGEVWSMQYLLAAMLFCPADQLPMPHDLQRVPGWFLASYLCFLQGY